MRLIANECAHCRRPVGYITKGAFEIPMLCVLCVGDPEILKEWGHKVAKTEKPIKDVLRQYQLALRHFSL